MTDKARVSELFQAAIELPPDQRSGFLARECADDPTALAEINLLIAGDEKAEAAEFLDSPAIEIEARQFAQEENDSRIGQLFGSYKVLGLIAEGGMGEVYLAQDTKLNRKVAIKLTKAYLKTKEVLRRFHNEEQILANLQHANIARLYEAGTTDDGLPFFVMRYVEGKPLDQHANEKGLSIADRLKLFRTVCAAVTFAHQNLVVHRDLKPSNILVSNDGEPMLLDFGIAKLIQESDSGAKNATATLFRVMTPEYASPEQVKGEPVTTATDVYSLGVILYELLTGHPPYRVKSRQPEEMARAICEQQPEKPSTALTRRSVDGETNRFAIGNPRLLRGDLDNIVLKALRKEPQRRYGSVEQFSDDIRLHLEGLPVSARKDTFSYRASKFVQRNKIGAAATFIILLTLIGGSIATALEAHRARVQSARADQRFNQVRKLAHSVMFDYHDEIAALPGSTKVRERLVKDALEYLDTLSKDAGNDPSLLRELAGAYEKVAAVQGGIAMSRRGTILSASNLGNTKGAIESLNSALALRDRVFAMEPNNIEVRQELAYCYAAIGFLYVFSGPPEKAVEYLRKGLPIMEALVAEDSNNEDLQYKLANMYIGLAKSLGIPPYPNLGDTKAAIEYLNKFQSVAERLASRDRTNPAYQGLLAAGQNAFGLLFESEGRQPEALESYKKSVAIEEEVVRRDPSNTFYRRELGTNLGNVAAAMSAMNDKAEAIEYRRRSLAVYESMAAEDPNDAVILRDEAVSYSLMGVALGASDRAGALKNFQKALQIFGELVAKDPKNDEFRNRLANTYLSLSRFYSQAEDLKAVYSAVQGVKISEALVAASPTNATARKTLAQLYRQLGDSHVALAAKSSKQQRNAAKDAYQKALEIYQDMKTKGTLSGADAGKPDELTKEIAKCDAALKISN